MYRAQDFEGRSIDRAEAYYRLSAENGDSFGQFGLAGVLREKGYLDEALIWYRKAAAAGNSDCAFMAYSISRKKSLDSAIADLRLVAELGHPMARLELSFTLMRGRGGVFNILRGIGLYITNAPNVVRFIFQNRIRHDADDRS